MKNSILLLVLCFYALTASAQVVLSGKTLDRKDNAPLEFVNVKLTTAADTTRLVKGAMTDVEGRFRLNGIAPGDYVLTASYVGYRDVRRRVSIGRDQKHPTLTLHLAEDSHTLKEVTVTGQKSTMKLEVDRKSFDVGQLVTNAGASASEALENIPSVEVDNDGNVSLRGNTSVEVWINGKASGLTSDNRAEILQQLPAESIDRIEVIDNPSAKFSAEGSAGIINIILKKDRKPGYYGSVQAGGDTRGGAQSSFNVNYNSRLLDAYFNVGYRHRHDKGRTESNTTYRQSDSYQWYRTASTRQGNNLFSRAGVTLHATEKDDISLSGMMMKGGRRDWSSTPYHYGVISTATDQRIMTRNTRTSGDMNMYYAELNYRHNFTDKHYLDIVVDFNRWKSDNDNLYQDSTYWYAPVQPTDYTWQSRPTHMNNRTWEVKADYENPITEQLKLQAGYQGRFSHENTPQLSYVDATGWLGLAPLFDASYYNRFIYDMDLHAFYGTLSYNNGKFGVMAGLRGEYWKVNTESYSWLQEQDPTQRERPFKKDFFELFPSLFLSYQLTPNDQLQLNYTRRLRRPWGGQLNSFKNTQDATMISFGNPELTPEFSNSFSLNYLRTWTEHSMMISAYYRPTTDVMQRISWQTGGMMYQTNVNVARSVSEGMELTVKNRLFRMLDLTTSANAYYYKLNGFLFPIDGQLVSGDESHSFSWNARMTASLLLPYSISVQATGRYRSRQVITQGYRKPGYGLDLGARKTFFNKALTVALNCRDVFNSRRWETVMESVTFSRQQLNKRASRKVNLTVTWNFGNMKAKKKPEQVDQQGEMDDPGSSYSGLGEE